MNLALAQHCLTPRRQKLTARHAVPEARWRTRTIGPATPTLRGNESGLKISTILGNGFSILGIDLAHDFAQVGVPGGHERVGRFPSQRGFV